LLHSLSRSKNNTRNTKIVRHTKTGTIEDWIYTKERAVAFATCLDRQPAIMLTGMVPVKEVDAIDDACEDQGVELYLYDGMTLFNAT